MKAPVKQVKDAVYELLHSVEDFIEKYQAKDSIKLEKIDGSMALKFPTSGLEIKPLTQQATEEGIKFFHQMHGDARYTVAYRPITENGKMLEIAVAYTHPRDQYCKRTGARLAAERFLEGKTVVMPIRDKNPYKTYYKLATLFHN